MAENINLGITIDAKSANNAIKGLEKSFEALKVVAGAAVAVFAGQKVINFFEQGIDAAVKQQDAMSQLAQQLRLTGEASDKALKGFSDFADEMEKSTKYGDDVILNQLSIAKSFGISNDKAKLLVKAATELSAATGKDLEGSVRQLGLTFSGVTGKLDEQIPALRGVKKSALEAGAALDIVISRFGGSAGAEIQTFSGSMQQMSNAFGNLQESFGNLIVQNPVIIGLFEGIRSIFQGMETFINGNADALRHGFNKAIVFTIKAMGYLTKAMAAPIDMFRAAFEITTTFAGALLQVVKAAAEFDFVERAIKFVLKSILRYFSTVLEVTGTFYSSLEAILELVGIKPPPTLANFFANLQVKVEGLTGAIDEMSIPDTLDDATRSLAEFQLKGVTGFDKVRQSVDLAGKELVDFGTFLDSLPDTTVPKVQPGIQPGKANGIGGGDESKLDKAVDSNAAIGKQISTVASAISQGYEGAAPFIANTVGGVVGSVLGPAIGGAVAQALEFGFQQNEMHNAKLRGFMTGLSDSLANFNENLRDAPAIIAQEMPKVWRQLILGFPEFIKALWFSLGDILQEILKGWQYMIGESLTHFLDQVGKYMGQFADYFKEKIGGFFQKDLPRYFKEAFAQLGDIGTQFYTAVVDAGQAFIDKVTGKGAAKGGYIGQSVAKVKAGGGNISEEFKGAFGLTGEPATTVAGTVPSEGFTIDDVVLILIQIRDQLAMPVTATAKAMVNDKVLADIILDLSRRNARLTA